MFNSQYIHENVSPWDVPTTVERIVAAAASRNWQNPATHNLQQSLAKAGKEVKPVQVVEICKPEFSGQMLERNHERIMSILMPCRISVYEKEDGSTYVAFLDMSNLSEGMNEVMIKAVTGASEESAEIVAEAIRL